MVPLASDTASTATRLDGSRSLRVYRETSRWVSSEITFGPVGRIVATCLVLAPVVYGIFVNILFALAAVIWLFVLPLALRDIWARVTRQLVTVHALASATPPLTITQSTIGTRTGPRRW